MSSLIKQRRSTSPPHNSYTKFAWIIQEKKHETIIATLREYCRPYTQQPGSSGTCPMRSSITGWTRLIQSILGLTVVWLVRYRRHVLCVFPNSIIAGKSVSLEVSDVLTLTIIFMVVIVRNWTFNISHLISPNYLLSIFL